MNYRLPVPTVADDVGSSGLRPRTFPVLSLDPEIVCTVTEPDLHRTAVVCEATRVFSLCGRVFLDDATLKPGDYSAYELVDYKEQKTVVERITRNAAKATRRARKPLHVPAPQWVKRARSATSMTVSFTIGDPFAFEDDDQIVTNSSEATFPERQEAEKSNEVVRSNEMDFVSDATDDDELSFISCSDTTETRAKRTCRIFLGKDLRLTADMLRVVPKDHQWTLIRSWVDLLSGRLIQLYYDVYDANSDCEGCDESIARAKYDIAWARNNGDVALEAKAVRRLNASKARQSHAAKIQSKGRDTWKLFEYYYRTLMFSLGHLEMDRCASEEFDPWDPFKSFSKRF